MGLPQLPLEVELVMFLGVPVQPQPIFASGMLSLVIKGKIPPHPSGIPVNYTLPLIEDQPMIIMRHMSVVK